ncbi:8616_t:CDS:2, partial [Funneliformis geosporum]
EEREEKEGIGIKLNDQINIYIEARKSPEQTQKFDQLFTELKKEINKLLSGQSNLKAEKDYHYHKLDEDEKGFYVYLNYPGSRDIQVTIHTAKDEIRNAELAKNILKLKK